MPKKATAMTVLFFAWFQRRVPKQVGLHTPNASSELDMHADNKGFLPPRVALTATNVAGPTTSPLSATVAISWQYSCSGNFYLPNVIPGYYYWNGSAWDCHYRRFYIE